MNRIKTRRLTAYEKRNLALRWIIYAFIILLCFVFLTSGSFRKPLILIPVALCISSYAREHNAVITGIICGLLLDIVCNKLFGFNAIILMLMCAGVSLLYKYYLTNKFLNFLVLSASGIFIQGVLDYFFFYAIWEYSNVSLIYTDHILPCCIYTLISAFAVYPVIHSINRMLRPQIIRTIEEAVISDDDQQA